MSGFGNRYIFNYSRTRLACKKFTRIIKRRHADQQPGTKSTRGPADNPRINRSSTACFVPLSVYIGIRLFVLPETRPREFSSIVWKIRRTVVFWANRPAGVPSCPSALRPAAPPCAARPRPTYSWYVRVLDSTGDYFVY